MLAVIVIMALVIAVAIPTIKTVSSTALGTGARQLSNAMMLARQYSINMRTPVRLVIATDLDVTNVVGTTGSNLVCRGYAVYYASNDLNGVVQAWWPLQDWRGLPTGVIITEHNTSAYSPALVVSSGGTITPGQSPIQTASSVYGNTTPAMTVGLNLYSTNTISIPNNSFVEFRPTGEARYIQNPIGVAAIRLAQGSVVDAKTLVWVVNDGNNWVYIEYDNTLGRVRTRYPDSYQ